MKSQDSIKWWSNEKSRQYQMVVRWKVKTVSNGGQMESQDNIKWWSDGKSRQYQMVVKWKANTVSNGSPMESQDSIKWWSNGKSRQYQMVVKWKACEGRTGLTAQQETLLRTHVEIMRPAGNGSASSRSTVPVTLSGLFGL